MPNGSSKKNHERGNGSGRGEGLSEQRKGVDVSDQGKWFKLWESSLDDQDLENLSIHEWFCWARFGTYLKKHGKEGKIRLRAPATALTNLLRLPTFSDVINMLKRFPNYHVEEGRNETANVTNATVSLGETFHIKCSTWSKYQGDFSTDRTRKWRAKKELSGTANVTRQEEKRGEEKRREEKRINNTGFFETLWAQYPNRDGKKLAKRSFENSVKTEQDKIDIQKALTNYLASAKVRDGFIKNGSTWFNNWRDWVNYKGIDHATNDNARRNHLGPQAPAGKYAAVTENV